MNIGQGRQTVTTNGTAVALGAQQRCHTLVISAEDNNTEPITVGGYGVIGAQATRQGTPISPVATDNLERTITLYDVDLARVFIDSVVDTEGVTFSYTY